MTRWRKTGLFVALGILVGLALAIGFIALLTRTEYGAERVRRLALGWLSEQVHGEVQIGRIAGPSLLGGVTLHDFSIRGTDGREFVSADSARVEYNWRTILGGRILLERVSLYHPRIVLEQLPGDTLWNFQEIFPDTSTGPDSGRRRDIIFLNARVYDGTVIVRTTWEGPTLGARAVFDTISGGTVRVMEFDDINADFDRVVWESSIEDGKLFDLRSASAHAFYFSREPIVVKRVANAKVTFRDTLVTFDAQDVELPASRAQVFGTVVMREGRNFFDVQVNARQVSFSDLKWIDPGLPDEGSATGQVRIQSQPKGTLWYLRDARITAPGTRLAGSVGLVTGDTLYFTQVNLRASPLNLKFLEGVLPENLPVEGLLIGTVEVSGPLSALEINGQVQYAERQGAPESSVRLSGLFDLRHGITPRRLDADVSRLDLALVHALRPGLALPAGIVSGHVEAASRANQPFRFAAELHHQLAGLSSNFASDGTWDARARSLDVRVDALPVSFDYLARMYPALNALRGEARGPVTLSGSIDDLAVSARLETSGGPLEFDGRLRESEGRRRYEGEGRLSGFHLERLMPDLPLRDITGTIRFDLTGTSPADASGSFAVVLDSSRVYDVSLGDVSVTGHLANGLLHIDTARIVSAAAVLSASGDFGIVDAARGELAFSLHADSTASAGVFEPSAAPTIGRAEASGVLRGNLRAFELDANAIATGFEWNRYAAEKANAVVAVRRSEGSPLGYRATLAADTLRVYGQDLSTGTVQIESLGGVGRFALDAGSASRTFRASADFRRDSTDTEIFLRDVRVGSLQQPWVLEAPFRMVFAAPAVQIDSFVLAREDGKGSISGGGALGWGEEVAGTLPLGFRLTFAGLPLGDYVRLLRDEASAEGTASGTISVAGVAHDPVMQANVDIDRLRYEGAMLDRAGASMTYASRAINIRLEADRNSRRVLHGDGRIPVDLAFLSLPQRALNEPMQLSLRADSMPAAIAAGLVSGFENVTGWINGNIQFRGTPIDPTMGGILRVAGAGAIFVPLGVQYRDITASLEVLDDSLVALTASARADEGRTMIAGKVNFGHLFDPQFDLAFDATDFPAAHRADVDAIASGRFHLGGRYSAPLVTGRLNIDRGALYLDELYRQYQIVQLDSAVLSDLAVVDTSLFALRPILRRSANPFLRNLSVRDLQLNVGGDSWMRSRALNVQVAGNLDVAFDRREDDLRLNGSLQAIRGTYLMEYRPIARRFDIRQGTVDFLGTPGLDPDLSFRAAYRARPADGSTPIDIVAVVSGTMRSPRIRLESESDEGLGESDLASYLFFGMPSSALSSSQSRTLEGSNLFGSGSSLAGFGLRELTSSLSGYLSGGLQSVAQDFGLLDYVSLTAADAGPASQPQGAIASLFQNTQIEFGRNLFGPDLFVIWSQRLASSSQPGVRLEWRFNPTYTAELFWEDRFARNPSFGLDRASQKKVYGFFLFREWGR